VVDSLEAIWMVFKDLLSQLIDDLTKRGAGARRIDVEFKRPYMSSIERTIQLSRPSRDPKNLFNLLRCSMEGLEEEARRHGGTKARRGKINRALFIDPKNRSAHPPSPHRRSPCTHGGWKGRGEGRATRQIDERSIAQQASSSSACGLAGRSQTTILDSPRRSPLSPALPPVGGGSKTLAPQKVEPTRHEEYICNGFTGIRITVPLFERIHHEQINLGGETEHSTDAELANLIERLRIRLNLESVEKVELAQSYLPERAYSCKEAVEEDHPSSLMLHPYVPSRPLHLLPEPIEVHVMVSPSEDRDGKPILFRFDNDLHELTHAIGPERIAGEWWHGHHRTRDYFDAEDRNGKRFWLFRVQETSHWYLHGEFE